MRGDGAPPRWRVTRVVKFAAVFDQLPPDVTMYEVGPRDGLQNESRMVPTDDKVKLIDALSETGLRAIEITSFVNPKWIPQLADGGEVSRRIVRKPGLVYSALVPNRQGLDAAIASGMKEVAVFMSASETHNKKNVNKTIAQTLTAFRETVPPALAAGLRVRAYVSTVYGCPYEGAVDPARARGAGARAQGPRLLPDLARRHDRRRQPAPGARRACRA